MSCASAVSLMAVEYPTWASRTRRCTHRPAAHPRFIRKLGRIIVGVDLIAWLERIKFVHSQHTRVVRAIG